MDRKSLRIEEIEKNKEEDIAFSVHEIEVVEPPKKKTATVLTLIRDAILNKDVSAENGEKLPRPRVFFPVGALMIAIFVGACCIYKVFDEVLLLPVLLLMLSGFIPLVMCLFYAELDVSRVIGFFDICMLVLIGGCSCIIAKFVENNYIYKVNAISYIGALLLGAFEQIILLLGIMLLSRKYRKNGIFSMMAAGCCFAAGFAFFESLDVGFRSMFINTNITGNEVNAILTDSDSLIKSFNNLLDVSLFSVVLRSITVCCYGSILGSMIFNINSSYSADKFSGRTSLILFFITIVLNSLWNMPFINDFFDNILKIIIVGISLIICMSIINIGLSKNYNE